MMNRRALLKALSAAAMACGFAKAAPLPPAVKRYGPVTVDRHRALKHQGIHLRVFHQGRDITSDCFYADDTGEGMADVFLRNAEGHRYLRPIPNGEYGTYPGEREAATDTVHGVTFKKVVA